MKLKLLAQFLVINFLCLNSANAFVCIEPLSCLIIAKAIDDSRPGFEMSKNEEADVAIWSQTRQSCSSEVGQRVYNSTGRYFGVLLNCELMTKVGNIAEAIQEEMEIVASTAQQSNFAIDYYDRFVMASLLNSIGIMSASAEFGVDKYFSTSWNVQLSQAERSSMVDKVHASIVLEDNKAFQVSFQDTQCFSQGSCPLSEYDEVKTN